MMSNSDDCQISQGSAVQAIFAGQRNFKLDKDTFILFVNLSAY